MTRILSLLVALLISASISAQTDLIISEYVEGWSTNKAIEIFNPTSGTINLSGYQLVRYANGEDVPPAADDWKIVLPDFNLEPFKAYVCVLDKRDPNGTGQEAPIWEQLQDRADVFLCPNYAESNTLYHNGDDALALEKTDGTLVDLFARWGEPRPAEASVGGSTFAARCWTDTPPFFTGVGVGITADHTLIRKPAVVNGVTVNPAMFNPLEQWDSLSANTFNRLGWHVSSVSPANSTPTFSQATFQFTISKQATNGTLLGKLTANDTENDPVRYYINSGNFIYNDKGTPDDDSDDIRMVPFVINKNTGELTVKDAAAFQYSKNDTVYINISANDGYSESTGITVIALLSEYGVNVHELDQQSDLEIFPNPVSNELNINSSRTVETVAIFDLSGRQIEKYQISNKAATLNVKQIKAGAYLLKATFFDGSSETQRIFKN